MSGQTKASSISTQSLGNTTVGATAKSTPVDADVVGLSDSAAGNIIKKLSWLNIKATLKTYFDTLYGVGTVTPSSTDTFTNKSISGSTNTVTNLTVGALASGVIDTDISTTSASDDTIPSAKAVKTYVDSLVAGLLDYRGAYDASVNTFPASGGSGASGAIMKGDMWAISVQGTLGGVAIQAGDFLIASIDTPGQTTGNWGKLNTNVSYTPEDVANKDATGGYAGLTLFKINFKNAANTFTSFFTNSNTAARTYTFQDRNGTIADDTDLAGKQSTSAKDATGGYVGMTLFKINFKNAANTFTNFLTNATTASRTWTFPDYDATMATLAGTETLTNKRFGSRAPTITQSATPTINTDNTDYAEITGLAQAITSFTTNLTGTPVKGDTLWISITDNGTARAITWGASFESSTVTLPTTTVASTRLDVGFTWNVATSKWRCVAVA